MNTWLIDLCYLFNDFAFRFYDQELPEPNTFYRTFNLIAKPGIHGHTGASRVIQSDWIHPVIPQSWYTACLREHGLKCEEPSWMAAQPLSIATPEWLVDVKTWCLVPYNSDTSRYFTLSYTWGNANCLRTTAASLGLLQQPDSLRTTYLGQLPRTIQDAIGITESLGETYLWIDSLCIVQDDAASLHNNLNNMHDIYARSALCLVAFAGVDANHGLNGLEGISGPRVVDQLTLPIADGENISWYNAPRARWDSFGELPKDIGRTYNERGWTFQEFIFAKRRLIFTDGPVRWICACTIWGEDKIGDLVIDNMTDMPFTKWKDRQRPGLANFLTDVASEYNERHFSFWQDILNAFLGIQNHLHRTFFGGLNHGHPDMFFDISLLWEPEAEIARRGSSEDAPTEGRYLPTWSWMGWHGAFRFLCDHEYECYDRPSNGILGPVAQWFTFQPSAPTNSKRLIKCDW
ncbi:HET-domain-containing protein, partial [Paraphaeosphaeria sporulosa]